MFPAVIPRLQSLEDIERLARIREMTARIRLPGDPPLAAPAPAQRVAVSALSPGVTRAIAKLKREEAADRAAADPRPAQAYAEGARVARANALAALAMCNQYGRADLAHQVVGMTPAEAQRFLTDRMWADAFDRARSTPSWMPR